MGNRVLVSGLKHTLADRETGRGADAAIVPTTRRADGKKESHHRRLKVAAFRLQGMA